MKARKGFEMMYDEQILDLFFAGLSIKKLSDYVSKVEGITKKEALQRVGRVIYNDYMLLNNAVKKG